MLRVALVAALLGLAACSPSAKEEPAEGADAITPRNPFFGTWELTAAKIAPWWDKQGEEPAPEPVVEAAAEEAAVEAVATEEVAADATETTEA